MKEKTAKSTSTTKALFQKIAVMDAVVNEAGFGGKGVELGYTIAGVEVGPFGASGVPLRG